MSNAGPFDLIQWLSGRSSGAQAGQRHPPERGARNASAQHNLFFRYAARIEFAWNLHRHRAHIARADFIRLEAFTMYVERHPVQSRNVLGIAPHRLMMARQGWSPSATTHRNVNARIMGRIDQLLSKLYRAGRRSVCIIDAACRDGRLLVRAAKRARKLGFVAIEAKGFDESAGRIALAKASSLAWRDPAVGFEFSVRDRGAPIPVEDSDADIVLTGSGRDDSAEIARVIGRDGSVVDRS